MKFQEASLELGRAKIVSEFEARPQTQFDIDAKRIYDDKLTAASSFWDGKLQNAAKDVMVEVCSK
jgi:hypothetical protein